MDGVSPLTTLVYFYRHKRIRTVSKINEVKRRLGSVKRFKKISLRESLEINGRHKRELASTLSKRNKRQDKQGTFSEYHSLDVSKDIFKTPANFVKPFTASFMMKQEPIQFKGRNT